MMLPWPATTGSSLGCGADNRVLLIKCYVPAAITVTQVSALVVSGTVGKAWGFGIYDLDGNIVIDSGPIIDPVGGQLLATFTGQSIGAGMYWLAFTSEKSADTIRAAAMPSVYADLTCFGSSISGIAANASVVGQLPSTTGVITTNSTLSAAPLVKFQA